MHILLFLKVLTNICGGQEVIMMKCFKDVSSFSSEDYVLSVECWNYDVH